MNKERENGGRDTGGDARVSRGYRNIATEHAPEHLNRQVLHQARQATRSQYGRAIRWTRPLAWAATIVLCLAITLQLTAPPAPNGEDSLEAPETAVAPAAPDAATDRSGPLEIPERKRVGAATSSLADPVQDDSGSQEDARSAEQDIADGVATFQQQNRKLLQRADEAARLQSGSVADAVRNKPALPAAKDALAGEREPESACSAEARESAATWIACIEQLEADGHTALAESERERMARMLPDSPVR